MAENIQTTKEKKKTKKSYAISFALVAVLTIATLFISLYGAGEGDFVLGAKQIWNALITCSPLYLAVIALVMILTYCIEALVMVVFCRLYTRHYYFHQGLANSFIGAFYNNVTPGASGGQVMQVYTLKKQGIEVSNAASIMVMWFIIYQMALISFDVLAIIFEWNAISSIGSFKIPNVDLFGWDGTVTLLPLIVIGFVLNLGVIVVLFLMSYSHHFHNFIMHYIVGFLGKIHILKNPDRTRENLRVQVENFKIELRRLQSNIPVTVFIYLCLLLVLVLRFSIPYFSGLALGAFGPNEGFDIRMFFDCAFRSAFHQMITGLIPLPGSAGVSELFFNAVFNGFYVETQAVVNGSLVITRNASSNIVAAQILWRVATYHLVVIVSGFVASFYHSRPRENYSYANRQTFVNLQLDTYEERRHSVETMFETRQLSRSSIRKKVVSNVLSKDFGQETGDDYIVTNLPSKKKRKDE